MRVNKIVKKNESIPSFLENEWFLHPPSFLDDEWTNFRELDEYVTIEQGRKDKVMLHVLLPVETLIKLLKAKDSMESIKQFLERVLNSYQE